MLVVIPSAGVGSRLSQRTIHMNKTMLLLGDKPVISKIIESYPARTEFLIGLGHKGDQIKEFLKLAYPKKKISFVKIKNYNDYKSSLTHTLKILSKKIKSEFIFHANDTIYELSSKINTNYDNLFISNKRIEIKNLYRSVGLAKKGFVECLFEKKTGFEHAYIGVSFIKDYQRFKRIINKAKKPHGEFEYFNEVFKNKKIITQKVKVWHDIGSEQNYLAACNYYEKKAYLKKYDESIFFHNKKVFKFFTDKTKVTERYRRSKYLKNIVPNVIKKNNYFYIYKFVEGKILSHSSITNAEFYRLMLWCKKNLFKKIKISNRSSKNFSKDCKKFYYNKTINRINLFRKKTSIKDKVYLINNRKIPKFSEIITKINWQKIFLGFPSKFHGDFHFENILKISKGYKLIDWREKFSNNYFYGDLYYDLAKLNHSFIVNHEKIDQNKFSINFKGDNVNVRIERRSDLAKLQKLFYKFLRENNYSVYVVNILTGLIFLNIAALHHKPYREFLYFLGLECLSKTMKNQDIIL